MSILSLHHSLLFMGRQVHQITICCARETSGARCMEVTEWVHVYGDLWLHGGKLHLHWFSG